MKTPLRPLFLPVSLWMASTSAVWAHPGHDDGHELTWTLGHLAAHPFATFGCAAVLAATVGCGWWILRRRTRVQPASVRRGS